MHEISIAHSIVATVGESLRGRNVKRVRTVRVTIGDLSGIYPEALSSAYPIAVKGTLLQGSALTIVREPLVIACRACGAETESTDELSFTCHACGKRGGRIIKGKALTVDSIEVDE